MTYAAVFFLLANTAVPVGPRLAGFETRADCAAFASKLIHHIKEGMGENYQPIGFRCSSK